MRRRFHADPMVRATELLLQERTPRAHAARGPGRTRCRASCRSTTPLPVRRRFGSPCRRIPRTHILSNGQLLSVMITAAGAGYSLARPRRDALARGPTRDPYGPLTSTSATRSPAGPGRRATSRAGRAGRYECRVSAGPRRDSAGATARSPRLWRCRVRRGRRGDPPCLSRTSARSRPRQIEITSYAEVVLAPDGDRRGASRFLNLFSRRSSLPRLEALLATRRPRASEEKPSGPRMFRRSIRPAVGGVQFETDRARFLGRSGGRSGTPDRSSSGRPLWHTVGSVLDPIFAAPPRRARAGSHRRVTFATAVAGVPGRRVEARGTSTGNPAFERRRRWRGRRRR